MNKNNQLILTKPPRHQANNERHRSGLPLVFLLSAPVIMHMGALAGYLIKRHDWWLGVGAFTGFAVLIMVQLVLMRIVELPRN